MEKCKICKQEKENIIVFKFNDKFVFLCEDCRECIISLKNKICYEEYKKIKREKMYEYKKEHKNNNKEKYKEYQKKYREKHKEEIKEKRLELKEYMAKYMAKYGKKYREENKAILKEKRKEKALKLKKPKREKQIDKKPKKQVDENLKKLKARTRCLINKSFVRKGYKKNTKTQKLLGCDFETFNKHLLQTFKNNYGYEWNKIEPVDIDHIMPLATAKSEEDVIKLCHYTNLQLLKRTDNKKKHSKVDINVLTSI